jgi:hypothetical protein
MTRDDLIARATADRTAAAERARAAQRQSVYAYLDHRDGRVAGPDATRAYEALQAHHLDKTPRLTWDDFPHVRKCALVVEKVVLEGEGDNAVLLIDRQDWNDVLRVLGDAGVDVHVKHLD